MTPKLLTRLLSLIFTFVCFFAVQSATGATGDAPLPTTEQFNSALTTCALGSKTTIDADLIGKITSLYNDDRTKGAANFETSTKFLEQFAQNDRPRVYELYNNCIFRILHLGAESAPKPFDIGIANVTIYPNLDETSVSMSIRNLSDQPGQIQKLRMGVYDATGQAITITQPPNLDDTGLAPGGVSNLFFSVASPPKLLQLCSNITDATGKNGVDKRIFLRFRSYDPNGANQAMGEFVQPTSQDEARYKQQFACPGKVTETSGCSAIVTASTKSKPYLSQLPQLAAEALAIAQAKAPGAGLSYLTLMTDANDNLEPTFVFVSTRSDKQVNIIIDGCRLRSVISDYTGGGWPIFDANFLDLPEAIDAARRVGMRGAMISAILHIEPARPNPLLLWQLKTKFDDPTADFYFVSARPNANPPRVWRCRVTSMDGTQYKC